MLQNHDIVAVRQTDGRYLIREWVDGREEPVHGYAATYDERSMYRSLDELRPQGDTYVREGGPMPPARAADQAIGTKGDTHDFRFKLLGGSLQRLRALVVVTLGCGDGGVSGDCRGELRITRFTSP